MARYRPTSPDPYRASSAGLTRSRATSSSLHLAMSSRLILLVTVLAVAVECSHRRQKRIVGGTEAPVPPVDDPVVFVTKQEREARVYGLRDHLTGYYMFRGIRFAEPPVGIRRFQRPVPMFLDGDVNATDWGAPCLQPDVNGALVGSEDCLFLNVFTPALPDATDGYPVFIWIHGGGFRRGAATQYEMRNLVNKNTIVVSIQYRLGSLGFLCTNSKDLSGNNGLFDMILATEWVRDYIEFFGGNNKNIIAFGQGSGASAAYFLGMSKFGRGYYNGIVAMSGTPVSRSAVDRQPRVASRSMATSTNCPENDTLEMVRCLRELPASQLIEQDSKQETSAKETNNFVDDLSILLNPGPVVEGKNDLRSLPNFVTQEPEDSLAEDNIPDIPLLTGVVKDETGGAVHGPFKNKITQMLKSVPDFLTKILVPSLQKVVPIIGNVTQQFVPAAFTKYLNPIQSDNNNAKIINAVEKVSQALNDAIFNVPAFLTVRNWSKKSKAFLYSFDHDSKKGFGKDFLDGLPIIGNSAQTGKTSHGDDLGYIFEPNNIFGKPLPKNENFNEEDERVKEIFTDLIVNFAKTGNVSVNAKSKDGNFLPLSLPSFFGDGEDNTFLSIKANPKISKQFKFCEMGLWTGINERFTSAVCSLFHVDLKNPLKTVHKTLTSISKEPIIPKVGKVVDLLDMDGIPNKVVPTPKILDIPKTLPNPLPNKKIEKAIIPNLKKTTDVMKVPLGIPKNPISLFG